MQQQINEYLESPLSKQTRIQCKTLPFNNGRENERN